MPRTALASPTAAGQQDAPPLVVMGQRRRRHRAAAFTVAPGGGRRRRHRLDSRRVRYPWLRRKIGSRLCRIIAASPLTLMPI